MAQSISQEAIGATGLPGATAASRHAGATTSGAPTTGTFAVGDYVVDQTGSMYVCTVAGTPGTWKLSGVSVNENIAGKNILINGAMDFWQRGTSFSSLSTPTYVADRWNFYLSGSGALTISQSTTVVPPVAGNSMKLAVTTSATSGIYFLGQTVEANNIMATQWGTSSAQTVTMSFWVYSSLTGTFTASIRNGTSNRSYLAPYTISTANTWQYVTITIPGDTNSAWIGSTSGTSAGMYVGVDCGSTTTSSSTANTWITGNYTQLTTSTNFMGSTSNVMYVSAFQLEIAPQATPFSRAGGSIGGELLLCQRYFQTPWLNLPYGYNLPPGYYNSTTGGIGIYSLLVTPRVAPSFSILQGGLVAQGASGSTSSITFYNYGYPNTTWSIAVSGSGYTAWTPMQLVSSNTSIPLTIAANSEL